MIEIEGKMNKKVFHSIYFDSISLLNRFQLEILFYNFKYKYMNQFHKAKNMCNLSPSESLPSSEIRDAKSPALRQSLQ